MFQNRAEQSQKDFNKLVESFNKEVFNTSEIFDDNKEWDMDLAYSPNHACIWNSPHAVNVKCKIMQKNSKIAIVQFLEPIEGVKSILACIYRLEDLSKYL